jgi:hypothetical protein
MSPHLLSIVFGVLGLVLGPLLALLAAKRTPAQPAGNPDESAEEVVLASALSSASTYVLVSELKEEHFTSGANKALWRALVEECAGLTLPESGSAPSAYRKLARAAEVEDLRARVVARGGEAGELASRLGEGTTPRKAVKAASKVYSAVEDREQYLGASPVVPGGPGEAAWVRRYTKPSLTRTAFSALFLGAVGALAPVLGSIPATEGAGVVSVVAFFVLGAASLVWALVDHDTLYLDYPTFFTGAALAWLVTAAAALSAGEPGRLLLGAGAAVVVGVFFEVLNRAYQRVRGVAGMGFGDTLIILATVGVPVALSDDVLLGLTIVMASALAAIPLPAVVALRQRAAAKRDPEAPTRPVPFAFGPYLALGWILGYPALLVLDALYAALGVTGL